jgi:hypothetical protein
LGSGRYFRRGGRRRYANADAHCYSDSHRYGNGQPHGNSIGHSHAATDANTQSGAISKAAPNPSAEAIEFRRADSFFVIGERSLVVAIIGDIG